MGDEFHAVLKLITGEEIFSLVSVDENDGDSIIMLSNPVIMKMLSSPAGKYVKVKPWLELPDQDLFLIKYDKIITMSEVTDNQMIKFYNRYLNEDDIDIEIENLSITFQINDDETATATFQQIYSSEQYSDSVKKEIILQKDGNNWKITAEKLIDGKY